ncbi:MAG: DNA-directed RNA polymerase subunit A'' [Candidatus Aenigmarchaeota archaeon]|nr:DNA-directed RNA polymerase subunit A'' [Candidatus Aenigmarchaeota archaeon]
MASQSDRLSKVTHGLPRLIEIFDTRKSFAKNMIIYLKAEYNTKEKARDIANTIKESRIADIILSDSIDLAENSIELELDNESDRDITKSVIEKYIKEAEISSRGRKITIKPKKENIKNLRKLKTKAMRLHIRGIQSIDNVVVIKDNEDWIIQTTGSNLKKVFQIDGVDIHRTTTNDIYQVLEVLGIEAARNMILRETLNTLGEQGLDVDVRHILLLADMMSFDGTVKDIGRYGVSGKKSSVLARANFEETKKHLINASFSGETDRLDGIIENIIVGQIAPVGTGMVKLGIDMEKMKALARKK